MKEYLIKAIVKRLTKIENLTGDNLCLMNFYVAILTKLP